MCQHIERCYDCDEDNCSRCISECPLCNNLVCDYCAKEHKVDCLEEKRRESEE